MDKIFIHALKTEAIIGIFDWERQVKQTVIVDIEISADIAQGGAVGFHRRHAQLQAVAKRVLAFVEESKFHLVETLAEHIAMLLLEDFGIDWVSISLSKPGAIRSSRDVGVMLERDRNDLAKWRAHSAAVRPDRRTAFFSTDASAWAQVAKVAEGAPLSLSDGALGRIRAARALVTSIVGQGVRAYGVNTGVGALCDVVVPASKQMQLSRNIVMSHAVGVGPLLEPAPLRAIMAAAVNNFAHGHSGVRPAVVEGLTALLNTDCLPEVPAYGSVGYLTHMAHIALVLLGEGRARLHGRCVSGAEAMRSIGFAPLVLEAKEGLSLVNGTPCATGLAAIALGRTSRLLDWADLIAAMTFENLHGQIAVFDADALGSARIGGREASRRDDCAPY